MGKGVGAVQGVGYPEPAGHVLDQAGGVGAGHSGGVTTPGVPRFRAGWG
jgi:hypothetical protein